MDPLSRIQTHHQYQNQPILSFAPPFFTPPESNHQQQHFLIQEFNTFTSPIHPHHNEVVSFQQENLPNSINLDRYYYPLGADQMALINPASTVSSQQPLPPPASSGCGGGVKLAVAANTSVEAEEMLRKKNHHNRSEKMRRKKLNGLFAALSSIIPGADQKKKQTAPSTVDRVIKYIPELQKEVEMLTQTKEQLLPLTSNSPTVSSNDVVFPQFAPASNSNTTSSASLATFTWSIQAIEHGNGEISILILSPKCLLNIFVLISEVLRVLEEEEGFLVVDVSSSNSSCGRVFYHVHVMEDGSHEVDYELLKKKLLSSCRKLEEMCLWMMSPP